MADHSTVARPYAKALFDLANGSGKLGSWSEALNAAAAVLADPNAKRVLGNLAPGDAIRVIAEDGPWLQVKTPSSEIAWVYSTFNKQP